MSRHDLGNKHTVIDGLERTIGAAHTTVVDHPIYERLNSRETVKAFTENHVFAVWGFMSMLKRLQQVLTCVDVPWVPQRPAGCCRIINEIVLAEESDELGDGYTSHLELYLAGMEQAGADTTAVTAFLDLLRDGADVRDALEIAAVPVAAAEFVGTMWDITQTAPVHRLAGAFVAGWDALVPQMFDRLVRIDQDDRLRIFRRYVARHSEEDGGQRTLMTMAMLHDLCGEDTAKWDESGETVVAALLARLRLWDGIVAALDTRVTVSAVQ